MDLKSFLFLGIHVYVRCNILGNIFVGKIVRFLHAFYTVLIGYLDKIHFSFDGYFFIQYGTLPARNDQVL